MKKAVIYARYSSDAQTEQSIEGQLRVCQEYAQKNDMLIVDTYIDRAMTGTNDLRPDFQRMLRDSERKQFQVVLVYKLDRFSRDKYEATIHKHTLKENGVKLVSAMENIPDSPEGIILESLLEGMNQYYSAELAQKVNRGLRESWLKGNATGGRYYGYNIVDKKYVIDENEAEIVREVFTKYASGFQAMAISKELEERGVRRKDGKMLSAKYLYYILHNEKYTGRVERQGTVYDNIFPRIITDDLWERVNKITDENKHAPSRKKEIFDYILSGRLVCGCCKHRMRGESGTSHMGNAHYYYLCTMRRKKLLPCKMKPIQKQYLEDIVVNATAQVVKDNECIRAIAQEMYEVHQQMMKDDTNLKSLTKQRADALKASQNLIKAIEQGIITEQTRERLVELERQIHQLDFDIDREKQRNYSYLSVEEIEKFLRKQVLTNPKNVKIRKAMINMFIREVILYHDHILITYNFSDNPEHVTLNPEYIQEVEKQSEKAALFLLKGSCLCRSSSPAKSICKSRCFFAGDPYDWTWFHGSREGHLCPDALPRLHEEETADTRTGNYI